MKVVVFGGGGFIGSAIVDRLLKDGHSIRVFERPRVAPYRAFSAMEHVEWLTGDLLSMHDVDEAIDGVDVVVHLVSTTLPKNSNDDPVYDVQSNLVSTLQLLNLMVQKKVPRIIFISSGGTVYGSPEYLPIDERHPTDPYVSYGVTKLAIEKYLQMYQRLHGLKAVILRVANPYGERQRVETAQGAVGVFLYKALHSETIDIWGDGSVTRDYIYIGDVADAFARAVRYDGAHSVFNISSGQGTSLNELLDVLERALGRPVERNYLPSRPFDVHTSVLACDLAKSELGWSPTVGLEDGVGIAVEWLKKQSSL
jgi:UDP-glucose 4-epimerase